MYVVILVSSTSFLSYVRMKRAGQLHKGSSQVRFTLYRYNFCIGTEGVTVQLRLHCSGAEVVPDSLTVYTVPVAFDNQIAVLLLRIVKEQKYVSHVLTTRHSIVRSFFS